MFHEFGEALGHCVQEELLQLPQISGGCEGGSCLYERVLGYHSLPAQQGAPLFEHERMRNPILRFQVARDGFLQVFDYLTGCKQHRRLSATTEQQLWAWFGSSKSLAYTAALGSTVILVVACPDCLDASKVVHTAKL